ncbi:MAG: hypothetical protein ACRDOI_18250 [Trebonia sp.]
MRTQPTARRYLLAPALGLALTAALAACSSSSSSSSSSASTPPSAPASSAPASTSAPASPSGSPSTSAPASTSPADAATTVKKNWITFFNGKTPVATRVSLLEDGAKWQSVLAAQAKNPQAAVASASVQKIALASATTANVTWSILLSGVSVLAGQKGTAVLQGGVWKVSTTSFCGLLALQSGGKAVAGCPS